MNRTERINLEGLYIMRILVVGGLPRSLINFRGPMLRAMVSAGHSVWACANGTDVVIEAELKKLGVQYCPVLLKRTGINPLVDIMTLLQLACLIRKVKPQAVLAYTIKPVIYGGIAAALCNIRSIYSMITGLGYAFMKPSSLKLRLINILVKLLYLVSLKNSQKVFFLNPDDMELFIALKIVQPKQAVLINGTGVDVDYYPFIALSNEPVFLMIARLLADKGVRVYAAAAEKVKQAFPQTRFLLAGDLDPNPSAIRRTELRNWQKSGAIEYLGYLQDVRPAIAESSVYVLPSYYREGTPRTVLEAMSMGRPVITTDAPGCRETVQEGRNGFLVPVRNVTALVKAMKNFINEPELITKMGQQSRQIVVEKYDVKKVNKLILETMGL